MRLLRALIRKEALQILRDPSSLLIAFLLPSVLLFIYGYGVNLDSNRVRVGLVLEDDGSDAAGLAQSFAGSRFLDVTVGRDRRAFEDPLVRGALRGIIVIPRGFSASSAATGRGDGMRVQVIADGSEPNIASFVQSYANGVVEGWRMRRAEELGLDSGAAAGPGIVIEQRVWYNPELRSRNFLVPGSIAIIMTLIGTLLTALVIAREWERGTMEAMMATPVSVPQILLGKLIPYFCLGIGSMAVCTLVATFVYGVPLRGSVFALLASSSVFLLCALGQGLFISAAAKDQFVASQIALISAFLPAFMLSGFVFEIASMPAPIRLLTRLLPARYFVTSLQTVFLVGDVWRLLLECMGAMLLIAAAFLMLTARKTHKRLDA